MGKKVNQASTKICKADKKQLNSLINVLKPKVYIIDSSKFKNLVQELTGNGNGNGNENPISYNPPLVHQQQVMQVPIIGIEEQGYREQSFDSSIDSSEASLPTSFATASESSQEVYASSETFGVLESSFHNVASLKNFDFPDCGDVESWLLDMDNFSYNYEVVGNHHIPAVHQELSFCGYDFAELI